MDFGKRSCDKFVILVGFSPHPAFCQGEGVPYFNSVDGCHPSGIGIQKASITGNIGRHRPVGGGIVPRLPSTRQGCLCA